MKVLLLLACLVSLSAIFAANTCQRPKRLDTSFDIGSLDGSWYFVRGLNRNNDCYECHNITFYPAHQGLFFAEEYYIEIMNATTIHYKIESSLTQWNSTTPGVIRIDSDDVNYSLEWRIIDLGLNDDYAYVYYCGTYSGGFPFEGSVILSRTTTLSNDTISKLEKVATSIGLNLDNYCKIRFDRCDQSSEL
ncbi:Hypothetical predicted protein [Mytilus galloprovincialis]|uniref:VDE lipocalin domain-containing protein n=1 Tax=Mytilus galloprovincialis TaxID=29158 RepID=A0A8B6GU84_MYTGA|nr:Hypothetical predicted protein [Mytilus galloprovincialis]